MTAQPLIRMYEAYRNAARTVQELEAAGIRQSDISILANHFVDRGTNGRTPDRPMFTVIEVGSRVGADSAAGTAIAAEGGLLVGLSLLVISDIGPAVAAGWLTSPVAGLATGPNTRGLVRALTDSGINERRARLYANGVRGGATLVAVRSDGRHHTSTVPIMNRHSPVAASLEEIFNAQHPLDGQRRVSANWALA